MANVLKYNQKTIYNVLVSEIRTSWFSLGLKSSHTVLIYSLCDPCETGPPHIQRTHQHHKIHSSNVMRKVQASVYPRSQRRFYVNCGPRKTTGDTQRNWFNKVKTEYNICSLFDRRIQSDRTPVNKSTIWSTRVTSNKRDERRQRT